MLHLVMNTSLHIVCNTKSTNSIYIKLNNTKKKFSTLQQDFDEQH